MTMTIHHRRRSAANRQGFTLIELLVAITILAMLSALSLSMLRNVAEYSRIDRTKVIIKRLDTYLTERYNSYQTRTVPLRYLPNTTPKQAMYARMVAIRELMRMEMPDRISDLANGPQAINAGGQTYTLQQPSAWKAMRRKAKSDWLDKSNANSTVHESAECLYLMLSTMNTGNGSPLDVFSANEIGDTDGDGMLEVLDAWGQPVVFLRWAPGFTIEKGAVTLQTSAVDANSIPVSPDPLDPLHLDPAWTDATHLKPFALKPLVFSSGQDRKYDINTSTAWSYTDPSAYGGPSYPYYVDPSGNYIGQPMDADGDGSLSYYDNITNHYVETP